MGLYDTMGPGGQIGASAYVPQPGVSPANAAIASSNPWSTLLTGGSQIIPGIIGSNAASSAAGAQVTGYNNAIGTQTNTLGDVTSLWQPQYATGVGANANLAASLGLNGAAPNYSLFENSPGYKFSLDQSTQAINRAAAANGNLYSTSTLDALNKNAAGYASQNYNNYVTQLLSAANLGTQANTALTGANETAGNNISQAQIGIGSANASGILGASGATSSAINGGLSLLNGILGSGGIASNGSALTSIGNFAKSLFGGGSQNIDPTTAANMGLIYDPNYQGYVPNGTYGQTNESTTPGLYNDQGYIDLSGGGNADTSGLYDNSGYMDLSGNP